ncbi:MAG: macro domain-containing protein [Chitinophagales bacterium]
MAIIYKQGNIFREEVMALVNPVNTVGVMGKGLALQFKKLYPHNFQLYREAYKAYQLEVGKMLVTEIEGLKNPKYIVNFPTKEHWRSKSKMSYIEEGIEDLARFILSSEISSIALPALGCGLGGLDWEEVRLVIEERLGGIAGKTGVIVFEPK